MIKYSNKRNEGESFEDYKERRTEQNAILKYNMKKPKFIYVSTHTTFDDIKQKFVIKGIGQYFNPEKKPICCLT